MNIRPLFSMGTGEKMNHRCFAFTLHIVLLIQFCYGSHNPEI